MTAPRLAKLSPAELDEQQRALYDSIASGPRARGPQLFALTDDAGGLEGPFNAMLLSPPVGSALQALGSAVRYGSGFANRHREIAILVVAHAWDCAFEVYAHEAVGRAAGLSDDEFAALRDGEYERLAEHDRLVAKTSSALAARSNLTDQEFSSARDALGLPLLFELTTLVGYYATLALQLRVFEVGTPA
jgi:4-carboxymuconolactone decarboxylase